METPRVIIIILNTIRPSTVLLFNWSIESFRSLDLRSIQSKPIRLFSFHLLCSLIHGKFRYYTVVSSRYVCACELKTNPLLWFFFSSAPLRCNGADYVFLLFFFKYIFCIFLYSPIVFRNYSPDSHQIFSDCVFWWNWNNPVVIKSIWRHFAEKNAKKEARICLKFQGLTQIFYNNFEADKDNSNLKQTWTIGL